MRSLSSLFISLVLLLSALTAWAGPVDINTADAATLARELNGVGPARANAIVAYRTEHGPFKSIDDLRLVKNMPQKVIDNNRELLRMEGGGGSRAAKPGSAAPGPQAAGKAAGAKPAAKP